MTRTEFLGLVALISIGALSGVFLSSATSASSEKEWQARIATIGGRAAYKELERSVRFFDEGKKHTQAHFFGGALYEVDGLAGLSVCDTQFSYGCFHEFLGRAIADLGISSVRELNALCFQALGSNGLSCQHGIGHGVQAFFGYTEPDLLEALDACADVAHIDPIGGCYSGVFMEYNFQTSLGEQAVTRTSDNKDSPCDVVVDRYRDACVFSQPQWWYQSIVAPKEDPYTFSSLGGYCESLARTSSEIEQCYRGIGNIVPQVAEYNPARTRALCEAVSTDSKRRLWCFSSAANSIGVTTTIRDAEQVCRSLTGDSLTFCIAYARNEANALLVKELPNDL